MIGAGIPHIFDMCATSIVYRLWTNQDIYENWHEQDHWKSLETKVTSDLKRLPLPDLVKTRISSIVMPAGRHFFGFLNVWFTKVGTDEKWLTKGSLSNSLTLYAVGIINQRETAKKLLKSKPLDFVIAFRLACINFLEKEVLKLWPLVSQYFLNKIVLEYLKLQYPSDDNAFMYGSTAAFGNVEESKEVLFWIGYCLSREQELEFRRLPHYTKQNADWYTEALYSASGSGDIAFFEYFMCSSDVCSLLKYPIQMCLQSNDFLISFFYHFSSLPDCIKKACFQRFPQRIMSYFLQWPLSSLVLEYPQQICDLLIELNLLDWLLATILEILYGVDLVQSRFESPVSSVYCADHVEQIWATLWQICPDEKKLHMMDTFAFTDKLNIFLVNASCQMNFDVSTFKDDLRRIFLLNGDACLRFLGEENLADSLGKVFSEYMPEKNFDFQELRIRNPFLNTSLAELQIELNHNFLTAASAMRFSTFILSSTDKTVVRPKLHFDVLRMKTAVSQEFINYIQEFLYFSNNLNNSHFYS